MPADNDAFLAFKSELAAKAERATKAPANGAAAGSAPANRVRWAGLRWLLVPVILAPIGTGIVTWGRVPERVQPEAAAAAGGSATPIVPVESAVTIKSFPEGATVLIDGTPRGVTPLQLSLPIGKHAVELRNGAATRSLSLDVEAGVAATQYIEIGSARPPAPSARAVGGLEVQSEPAGARVLVDGVARGVTPLTLTGLSAGPHRVMLLSRQGTFTRVVNVAPGATATVVASLAASSLSVGWVVIESPLEFEVFQDGRRLGTALDRIMIAAGVHQLDLVNQQYSYRTTTTVEVTGGQTAIAKITVPLGRLSVNATPWAEVLIDGKSVGTTPLANLGVPIGVHEIVWRHPRFGERRQEVSVTAAQPVRIGMDFGR